MPNNAHRRKLFAILTLVVLAAFLFKSIPVFIDGFLDKNQIRLAIEQGLHKSMGVEFHIRELRLETTFFHGLRLHLDRTRLTGEKNHPLGEIRHMIVQIRYLPLLFARTPEIAKIRIDDLHVPVGSANLFRELKLNFEKPEPTDFLNPPELRDTEILLTHYAIDDSILSPDARKLLSVQQTGELRSFRLRGSRLSVRHLKSGRPIVLHGQGEMLFRRANEPEKKALSAGRFGLVAEAAANLTDEGHTIAATDLRRLELKFQSSGKQKFNLQYALGKPKRQNRPPETAKGRVRGEKLELTMLQAIALQLGDTLALPVPPEMRSAFLAGKIGMDTAFKVRFTGSKHFDVFPDGKLDLDNVAVADPVAWPRAMISRINGRIDFLDHRLRTKKLTALLGDLPFLLDGAYWLDTGAIRVNVAGRNLKIASLQRTLNGFNLPANALDGRDLRGLVDFTAQVSGTVQNPRYSGLLTLKDGVFADKTQGLSISNADARVHFSGTGLKNPLIRYDGEVRFPKGSLDNQPNNLRVSDLNGRIAFQGVIMPTSGKVEMPVLSGFIAVQGGQYRDPSSGLLVDAISGVLRLVNRQIRLENFQGLLGGSVFRVSGTLSQTLDSYQVQLTGNDIDLPRFKREVLAKLPQTQEMAAQFEFAGGMADVDLLVSTGMKIHGVVDVQALALRSELAAYPLQIPRLALRFNEHEITIPQTTMQYGTIPLNMEGVIQPLSGVYRLNVAADSIPADAIRDHQPKIQKLTGQKLPEVWNTAGGFALNAEVSNQNTRVALDFKQLGLSWEYGDFPVYDLNGRVLFQQPAGGKPTIATRNLRFRYGNEPIMVEAQNGNRLRFLSTGTLSGLVVNHFLVSPQSNATPYRDVPFRVAAEGTLAGPPGTVQANRNDISAVFQMDLNQNFKYKAAASPVAVTPPPKAANANGSELNPFGRLLPGRNAVDGLSEALSVVRQNVKSSLETLLAPLRQLEAPDDGAENTVPADETMPPEPTPAVAAASPAPEAAGDDNAYLVGQVHMKGDEVTVYPAALHLFEGGTILAEGLMTDISDQDRMRFRMHVLTQPALSLDSLSLRAEENDFVRGAKGTVSTDLLLDGYSRGVDAVTGWLALDHVAVPFLTVQELTGRMVFDGRAASADIAAFRIPGVNASLSAVTDDVLSVPATLEDVKIHGSLLSVESLTAFNEQIVAPILVDQLAHNFARPWQQGDPTIPVQFRNADLRFDEAIFQNILIRNLMGGFSAYANGFFELTNARLEAAGGTATGYLSMNPGANNFMTLELNANNVSANALTRALLNVTNQIFGSLDGTVRFTTSGTNDDEMLANANGTVGMKIRDGRLPAIAKVETLLTAANVLRGGILGLNLNNLFRSLQITDTNYFAELSGDMLVANKVLYTENLLSDGKNLDLFIQGSVRMDNGNSNMVVNGTMTQDVSGRFGALGSFSLGRVISFVPALGNFGQNRRGLLQYVPGVGYVPGLGGPAGNASHFQVHLVGDLSDPGAIQGFRWVKAPGQ